MLPANYFKLAVLAILFSIQQLGVAQFEEARVRLDQLFETNDLMGCSVIAVCDQGIAFEYYNGYSDEERTLLVDEKTAYRIASISKNISSVLLLKLAQEGKINLDEDVNNYLPFEIRNPNFPNQPLTSRMFLSHQSSIIDGSGYGSFLSDTYASDLPPSLEELLDPAGSYYTTDLYLGISPGSYFSYSNLNYGVVASLVEAASGQRFDRFADEILFKPLGLDAGYHPSYLSNINDLAVLYRKQGSQWIPQWDEYSGESPELPALEGYIPGMNGLFFSPQGGVRMNAKDLASILLLHLNDGTVNGVEILNKTYQDMMENPAWNFDGNNGNNYFGLFRSWGLGTHISTNTLQADIIFPDKEMKGHPGEAYGLISDMYYDSESGTGIIFMTNGSGKGFTVGNSAFYTLEDSIFSIIHEEVIVPCQLSSSFGTFNSTQLEIFPNPVSNTLYLKGAYSFREALIHILDFQGKVVAEYPASVRELDVSKLTAGSYLINIKDKSGTVILKREFIKQ